MKTSFIPLTVLILFLTSACIQIPPENPTIPAGEDSGALLDYQVTLLSDGGIYGTIHYKAISTRQKSIEGNVVFQPPEGATILSVSDTSGTCNKNNYNNCYVISSMSALEPYEATLDFIIPKDSKNAIKRQDNILTYSYNLLISKQEFPIKPTSYTSGLNPPRLSSKDILAFFFNYQYTYAKTPGNLPTAFRDTYNGLSLAWTSSNPYDISGEVQYQEQIHPISALFIIVFVIIIVIIILQKIR